MLKGFNILWKKYSYILIFIFVVAGLFDMRLAISAIACMLGPVILALFGKGRYWCGNVCPRGSFYDNVIKKFSKKKPVPKFIRRKYFRAFVVVFMLSMFGMGIYKNWGNPYAIGMVVYRMIVVTTIIGITLSFFYNQRSWCNFCPMGSIASFVSYLKKDKKSLSVASNCVSCKLCEKKCPMSVAPYEYKDGEITHHNCIQCGECVYACPKDSIGYEKLAS